MQSSCTFSHLQHIISMLSCTCEYAEWRMEFRRIPGGKKGASTMSTFTKIVLPVIIAAGTSGLMFTAALI